MKKFVGYIVIFVIVAAVGYGIYSYQNGLDFVLYDEAKQLEEDGDVDAAFEKIKEAMMVNPKNRKVQLYRTELNFVVQNNKLLEEAKELKVEAVRAINRGDYLTANDKIALATEKIYNISPSYKDYDKVLELDVALLEDINRIKNEAPKRYYTQARGFYSSGEYERAYNIIDYIKQPNDEIAQFKNQIAYTIANLSYDKINSSQSKESQIRDAIYWYSLVEESSRDYNEAQQQIKKLNDLL